MFDAFTILNTNVGTLKVHFINLQISKFIRIAWRVGQFF